MEQEKKPAECSCEKCKCCKCGKGLKIAVVVTTILALAGVGFGVYGMFFKKDTQPATEPEAEVTVDEGEYVGALPVSYVQRILNQKFNLPAGRLGWVAKGGKLTEGEKAVIIQGVSNSSYTKDEECQGGAYITREEYERLYKSLFGEGFKYDPQEVYYTDSTYGYFSDKPCTCECNETAIENGYYQWNNNAIIVKSNLIVERVDESTIYGKVYALYDGEFDEPNEPQYSGTFEIKYVKNKGGFYITEMEFKH